jgi:hypothetical protein
MKNKNTVARPFENDYGGWFPGHAKTREGAINAAVRHMTMHGYTRCTVTDKRTNTTVARLSLDHSKKRITIDALRQFRDLR